MATTTPLANWPIPSLTDVPNGPAQFAALGAAAEKQVMLNFASVALRDAALPAPTAGMICYVGGSRKTPMWYGNGMWNAFSGAYISSTGLGNTPASNTGIITVRVGGYVEPNCGSDGKFSIDFPNGYTSLLNCYAQPASRAGTDGLPSWSSEIMLGESGASGMRVQARHSSGGPSVVGTVVSGFVGCIWHAELQ